LGWFLGGFVNLNEYYMGGGWARCSWRWNRIGCEFVIYTLHGNESACANFSPTISQK
jgi:hypothetical protein